MVNLKFRTVTELKQKASEFVSEVEGHAGKRIIITKNGRPVAVLQGVTEEELSFDKANEIQYAKHLIKQVRIKLKQEKTQDKPKKK